MLTSRVASVYFTDAREHARVKKAAKMQGTTLSDLMKDAAVKAADKILATSGGPCPTCGHRHGKKRAA
jgi:hypothetical protein